MRNSNKVLLIAAAAVLAFVLTFVVVMGLTARDLLETRGRTARAGCFPAGYLPRSYCLPEAANTFDLSC